MNEKEIISIIQKMLEKATYDIMIYQELQNMDFNKNQMLLSEKISYGAAFALSSLYTNITKESSNEVYSTGFEKAQAEINKAKETCTKKKLIIELVNMLGADGKKYYDLIKEDSSYLI